MNIVIEYQKCQGPCGLEKPAYCFVVRNKQTNKQNQLDSATKIRHIIRENGH